MKAYLLFFGVFLLFIIPALGSDWKDLGAVTLKWGETVNAGGYNITAIDFRQGTIEEIKNETKCLVEPDPSVRRIFGCDDWVMLKVLRNDFSRDVVLTKRNITVEGVDFYNETTYQEGDEMLRIKAEDVITGYNIPTPYAILRVYTKMEPPMDIKNLSIKKIVSPEVYVSPSWPLVYVTVVVENIGITNFSNIDVVDLPPGDYKTEPVAELRWTLDLKAGEKWQTIYSIKPLHPIAGTEYSLPQARLYVSNRSRQYNISSNIASFKLLSSDIVLNKTVDKKAFKPGDNITVLVRVENNGSRASLVKIKDTLPQNGEIVVGELNFSRVLQPRTSYNYSYVIRIKNASGNITIPAAELIFKEYKPGYDPERNPQAITGNVTSLSPVLIVETTPPRVSTTSATVQKTENAGKREDTSSRQEGSIVDGTIRKVRELWVFIKTFIGRWGEGAS